MDGEVRARSTASPPVGRNLTSLSISAHHSFLPPAPRYDKNKLGLTEKVLNDSTMHIQLDLSCEPGVHMLTFYGDKDSDETGASNRAIKPRMAV